MCKPRRTRRPVPSQLRGGRMGTPTPKVASAGAIVPRNAETSDSSGGGHETRNAAHHANTITQAVGNTDSTTPQPCRLVELPAELRNEIYELAFTRATPGEGPIDIQLLSARPPCSALLRTCRQINGEAKSLFAEAVQKYYNDEQFFFFLGRGYRPRAVLPAMTPGLDLQRMRSIRVFYATQGGKVYDIRLQPDRKSLSLIEKAQHAHQPDYFGGFWVCSQKGMGKPSVRFAGMTEEERERTLAFRAATPGLCGRVVLEFVEQLDAMITSRLAIPFIEQELDKLRSPIPGSAGAVESKLGDEWPGDQHLGRRSVDWYTSIPTKVMFR